MLVPPDAHTRTEPLPGKRGGLYQRMRDRLATDDGAALYRRRMAMIEPIFGHTKANRRIERFQRRGLAGGPLGMEADRRHPQPPQAPHRRDGRLTRLPGGAPANTAATRPGSPAARRPTPRPRPNGSAEPLTIARQPLYAQNVEPRVSIGVNLDVLLPPELSLSMPQLTYTHTGGKIRARRL